MKKTWILTPLLLGVALLGCTQESKPTAYQTTDDVQITSDTEHGQVVDEKLLSQPLQATPEGERAEEIVLEEFEPLDKSNMEFDIPAQSQSQQGGQGPGRDAGYKSPGGGKNNSAPGMEGASSSLSRAKDDAKNGQKAMGSSGAADHPFSGEASEAAMPGRYAGASKAEKPVSTAQPVADTLPAITAPAEQPANVAGGMTGPVPAAEPKPTAAPLGDIAVIDHLKEAKKAPEQRRLGEMAKQSEMNKRLPESERARQLGLNVNDPKPGDGVGPGEGGDKFEPIEDNNFITVADQPLSTFSIDVDTASYSKIRSYLNQFNQLPPRDAVRVEELVNYFTYDYAQPTDEHPFAANVEVASCPWNSANRLVRVGIKGKEIDVNERPASNIVFLLDVSGSMNSPNKLPLLKKGMKMLVDQLTENDKVSIVVYAGAAGVVLDPTYGYEKAEILKALDRLQAGGSTNGGQGIKLAYKMATDNFIQGGTNRVILCTDGDFNVGETSTGGLVGLAAEQAKKNIYLSILGFGIGNHNDSMLEQLSNKANGNYAFIDNEKEAKKVLVEQMSGTLLTIAKDVKIQIEFNPKKVASYRLVGYENRLLAAQDFNDDKKDAGEIGAGHTVTAFYEVIPAGTKNEEAATEPKVDDLKYQTKPKTTKAANSDELMTLKLRYKQPEEDVSTLMTYPVIDEGHRFNQATGDFQFATAVAMFGLKLRGNKFQDEINYAEIEELVSSNLKGPGASYREEFLDLVRKVDSIQK